MHSPILRCGGTHLYHKLALGRRGRLVSEVQANLVNISRLSQKPFFSSFGEPPTGGWGILARAVPFLSQSCTEAL